MELAQVYVPENTESGRSYQLIIQPKADPDWPGLHIVAERGFKEYLVRREKQDLPLELLGGFKSWLDIRELSYGLVELLGENAGEDPISLFLSCNRFYPLDAKVIVAKDKDSIAIYVPSAHKNPPELDESARNLYLMLCGSLLSNHALKGSGTAFSEKTCDKIARSFPDLSGC